MRKSSATSWGRKSSRRGGAPAGRCGFTLLEILLAVSILAVISTITFMSFSVLVSAWRNGAALTDHMHHGDYVIDQLVMALRSSYYPDARPGASGEYGFSIRDEGDSPESSDVISWVKLGGALVGQEADFVQSPHRIEFGIEQDIEGEPAVAVRAWALHGQPEDFDPEQDVETLFVSRKVTGFNCRMAYREVDEEIEWLDEWEDTNRIPTIVEITLYVTPMEENGDAIEVKRIVGIPVGALAWQ